MKHFAEIDPKITQVCTSPQSAAQWAGIGALARSIDVYKRQVYRGTHVTRLAIKLIALTFVRTSELIGAKWSEFDMEAGRWDIPEERMKMRTPHTVPLAKQAIDVLETLRTLTGTSELLFPGDRNATKPVSYTHLDVYKRQPTVHAESQS